MMMIRVFCILGFLLLSSPFLQVASSQPESESDVEVADVAEAAIEAGDLGIVGEDIQDFDDGNFSPAPGVETVCVFPKNPSRSVTAGEESELLVGMKNEGESSVNVIAIKASVHLPYDHHLLLQNLTAQGVPWIEAMKLDGYACLILEQTCLIDLHWLSMYCPAIQGLAWLNPRGPRGHAFNNATVPSSAQGTFPYIFAVSKFLQSGTYDLVGTIVYEIEQNPYQSTFYNGTIEVAEAGGPLSVESVFLFFLGIALVGFFGIWIRNQIQHLSKVSTHHHPCNPSYAIEHF
ncbi:translocon-associated protein (TRAP), alpha subunit [Actinidia rufa]|uniref:Translocon-associated protein (TRAP), alpha subunit n=1 Tax=Actinidia rufa TaxID=165716 RepID=A0A7J0DUS8_9ERIC|nr:translocon-associated protein (TRAP), alpha subunit [Actinidia rufa]